MKPTFAIAGLLLVPSVAHAQFPNLLELSGQYMPGAAIEDLSPTRAQVASYDAAVNLPVVLAEGSYLVLGATYHVDSVAFLDAPVDVAIPTAFHSVEAAVTFVQILPHDWSLAIRVAPGLAGDFAAVDQGLLRLSSVVMANHAFSDRFTLGGGFVATWSFGALLPLPALYLDWRPVDGLEIETFLPAFLWARWTLFDRVELGVRAEFQGNEYAVRDGRIRDRYPCAAAAVDDPLTPRDETQTDGDACLDHLAYSVGSAGLALGVRVFSTVWIEAYAGHTFFRRYDPKNARGDALPDGPDMLDDDWLFRAGLSWRIPNN